MDKTELEQLLARFYARCLANPDAIPVLLLLCDENTEVYSPFPAKNLSPILSALATDMLAQASVAVH